MDRLEAMSTFVAIVEAGSLTAASRRQGLPLPTVSRWLADLEAHLGARLLIRSTRKHILTEAGGAYFEACKRILQDIRFAERAVAGEFEAPRGDLTVTAPVVFGRLHVLPIVTEFVAAHPDINVRMLLSDRKLHLLDDQVDVAVRIGSLRDSSMIATRVGSVRHIVCGAPAYFERHGIPARPEDLTSHACVNFDMLGLPSSWTFRREGGRETAVPIRSRISVNTAEAALDAALAGVGVTRILSQARKALDDGELRIVLEPFEPDPMPVNILHAAQGIVPQKTRSFLNFAVERLRPHFTRS